MKVILKRSVELPLADVALLFNTEEAKQMIENLEECKSWDKGTVHVYTLEALMKSKGVLKCPTQ